MKKYIIASVFFFSALAIAQVGINTTSPTQPFQIDGKKDNVTAVQTESEKNDFVVDKNGYIGVGVANPQTRLHLSKPTSGAIKIVDGTEGMGKVLISDDQGVGTWRMPQSFKDVVLGKFYRDASNNEIPTSSDNNISGVPFKYLNADIQLTKGKWIINMGITLKNRVAPDYQVLVHTYLSSSKTAVTQSGWKHLGPSGNNTSVAGILRGYGDTSGDNNNFVNGSSLIEVTSDTATLFFVIENLATNEPTNGVDTGLKWYTASGYWENYFYAIPVN